MIDYATCCSQGQRAYSEDCVGTSVTPQAASFVLADGLGGHGMGDIASSLAVETTLRSACRQEVKGEALLAECFEASQAAILDRQESLHASSKMKTTMVLLHIEESHAYFGHIGDSRLYYFSPHGWKRLTLDHSVPQMLVATGEILEKDIRRHPDRNRLLRVLGTEWETPRYALGKKPIPVKKGEGFLLCSDGFWEYILEEEMQMLYRQTDSAQAWLAAMESLVAQRGNAAAENADNYSGIAVRVV